ncbi:MAG: 4'-phosphopantetheinyl transferase superfamily protein [Bacteroidota bacterium]
MLDLTHHLSLAATPWRPVDNPPALRKNTHLWRIPLTESAALEPLLSPEEKQRADSFHYPQDQANFIAARGSLRMILSKYVPSSPKGISFAYAAHGKPYLPDFPELKFNLSHAGGWGLLGIHHHAAIGVDVEPIDRSFTVTNLVERFFSPQEIPVILGLPPQEQHRAFFLAWTRKEAIIKAVGDGLRLPLAEFGVSILGEVPVRLLHMDWSPQQCDEWALASFMVADEVPAAVALRGSLGEVSFFTRP